MYCLERESKHVSLLYSEIEGRKSKMIQQTLEQKITINLSDITYFKTEETKNRFGES